MFKFSNHYLLFLVNTNYLIEDLIEGVSRNYVMHNIWILAGPLFVELRHIFSIILHSITLQISNNFSKYINRFVV